MIVPAGVQEFCISPIAPPEAGEGPPRQILNIFFVILGTNCVTPVRGDVKIGEIRPRSHIAGTVPAGPTPLTTR